MLGIHPKKYWRRVKEAYQIYCFKRQATACGVIVKIGEGVRLKGCRISSELLASDTLSQGRRSFLEIGDYCNLKYATFHFRRTNNTIAIGDGTEINAHGKGRETCFYVGENTKIVVGANCLFSNSIILSTTDFHSIYSATEEKINKDEDIFVGKHVWIGWRASICKGVEIGENAVVGACSVVAKTFAQGNCVIVGNPAMVKKENIKWEQ